MKKRIISAVLSMATAISTVTAISANAAPDHYWGKIDEALVEETFKDYNKLPASEYKLLDYYNTLSDNLYWVEKGNLGGAIQVACIIEGYDTLDIKLTSDADSNELKELIQAVNEEFEIPVYPIDDNGISYKLHAFSRNIEMETVKKIREIVGDKAVSFRYDCGDIYYTHLHFDYITGYDTFSSGIASESENSKSNEELIREYAENHSDEVEFWLNTYNDKVDHRGYPLEGIQLYYLIPKKELTIPEHIELAKDIYEETGLRPSTYELQTSSEEILEGKSLDLTDYLNGDANNDKLMSIADAAAIFQSLANPDKYKLSAQGEFNADFACDGITVDDAVRIQKKLAGIK